MKELANLTLTGTKKDSFPIVHFNFNLKKIIDKSNNLLNLFLKHKFKGCFCKKCFNITRDHV